MSVTSIAAIAVDHQRRGCTWTIGHRGLQPQQKGTNPGPVSCAAMSTAIEEQRSQQPHSLASGQTRSPTYPPGLRCDGSVSADGASGQLRPIEISCDGSTLDNSAIGARSGGRRTCAALVEVLPGRGANQDDGSDNHTDHDALAVRSRSINGWSIRRRGCAAIRPGFCR